jgi:hypothetical protein
VGIKDLLVSDYSVYRNYFEIQFTGLWAVPLLSASSMLE